MSTITLKESPNAVLEKHAKSKGARANVRPMAVVHIALFCLVIFGFFLSTVQEAITNKSQMSLLEKRPYATFPTLSPSLESVKSFPSDFQSFFNDRFFLRYQLVALLNELKWKVFKVSGSDKVLIGKHDWLFYIDGGNWETLRHDLLPPQGVEQFVHTFETRRAWLAQHHIKYLLVFAPSKFEIYPEEIPSQYKRLNKISMQDQVLAALRKSSSVEVLDIRVALLSQKKNFSLPLYWKNDSHWSELGGFIGYREIASYLNDHFGYGKPLEWNDVKIGSKPRLGGDLTSMLGLGAQVSEMTAKISHKQHWAFSLDTADSGGDPVKQHYAPFATEVNDSSRPRAYFMRDSFTSNMQPFLSEHFSRAFYHWNFLRKKDDDFLPDEILREHPDIVIQQVAECLLARDVFPNPPEVEASVMANSSSSAAKKQ